MDDFILKGNSNHFLKRLFDSEFASWFDLLTKCYSAPQVVTALERHYRDDTINLAQHLIDTTIFRPSIRKIKTVGIIYSKLYDGGAEKVISLLIPVYLKMGYSVVLVLNESRPEKEYPIPDSVTKVIIPRAFSEGRAFALHTALVENHVDVVVHHASSNPKVVYDIISTKALDIPSIAMRHELATQDIVRPTLSWTCNYFYLIFRLVDKLLVLDTMDETVFKLMGCNTKLIHNPIEFKNIESNYNMNKGYILWLGRMDIFQKNYLDPVKIMKLVVRKRPDAKMVILGGDQRDSVDLRKFIEQEHLRDNVEWVPNTINVTEYYRGAKIHLLTSSFESFSMVIAESKSYGIPLVTYDLPYLELLKDKKGYIAVEQDNIQAAADAIIKLFNNQTLCEVLSKEAKESIHEFSKFSLEQEWSDVFNALEHERRRPMDSELSEKDKEIQLFIKTMFFHYKKIYAKHKTSKYKGIKSIKCFTTIGTLAISMCIFLFWKLTGFKF